MHTDARNPSYASIHTGRDADELCFQKSVIWLAGLVAAMPDNSLWFLEEEEEEKLLMLPLPLSLNHERERK